MVAKKKADWVPFDKDEVEKLIAKLVKEGNSAALVGQILKDQYGIPNVSQFDIKIGEVVDKEKPREIPEDMFNIMRHAVNLHAHMDDNHKDANARHSLDKMESRVRRLGKYYKRNGKLPEDWSYSIEKARLLVK